MLPERKRGKPWCCQKGKRQILVLSERKKENPGAFRKERGIPWCSQIPEASPRVTLCQQPPAPVHCCCHWRHAVNDQWDMFSLQKQMELLCAEELQSIPVLLYFKAIFSLEQKENKQY